MTAVSKANSSKISKVLIANRGEIAVRIARAAKDSGIASVAVYADQDRDALHVKMADEAYALHGTTGPETYLVIEKLLSVARKAKVDAVHPGYGFLAENAAFAQAVIDAGLIWIGPSPEAIDRLGDKVSARHVAEKVGAPLAAGTLNPVSGAEEVLELTSHPVGGVCPFDVATPMPIYCDVSLQAFDEVVPAGGATNAAVKIAPERMIALVDGEWADLCQ